MLFNFVYIPNLSKARICKPYVAVFLHQMVVHAVKQAKTDNWYSINDLITLKFIALLLTNLQWTKSIEYRIGKTGSFEKGRTKSDVDTATYPWLYGRARTPGSGWFELHTGLVYVDAEIVITEKCV